MMRREYLRENSRAAHWSLPPSIFAGVLVFVATIAHWSNLLTTQNFVLVMATAFFIAVVGFTLAAFGFYALWNYAAKGGRRSAVALAFCAPVLGMGLAALLLRGVTAPLSDISTDKLDPPHFSDVLDGSNGENVNEPPRINSSVQTQYYPNLAGRRYALAVETIVGHVVKQIEDNGWRLVYDKPRYLGDGDWLIEAKIKTTPFGFIDSVVLRITDEGNASYVDMRSASNFGKNDLGTNARRIEAFMKDLDTRVSGQVPSL